jgi:hypothetical protein
VPLKCAIVTIRGGKGTRGSVDDRRESFRVQKHLTSRSIFSYTSNIKKQL